MPFLLKAVFFTVVFVEFPDSLVNPSRCHTQQSLLDSINTTRYSSLHSMCDLRPLPFPINLYLSSLLLLGVILVGNSHTAVSSLSNSSGGASPSRCPGTGSFTLVLSSSSRSTKILRIGSRFFITMPYPMSATIVFRFSPGDSGPVW